MGILTTHKCEAIELHTTDFGVGPVDHFENSCEQQAEYRVVFEVWDDEIEAPAQEETLVCSGHLDETSVSGVMYHVRTDRLAEEGR